MSWAAVGAILLGAMILKAILDPNTKIHRCPYCNLVVRANQNPCPRCRNNIDWT